MPYNRVADPLLNIGKPGRSLDWKKIRDNQDYFDAQITDLLSRSRATDQDIRDHFMSPTLDTTNTWATHVGASDTVTVVDEHKLRLLTNSNTTNDWAIIKALDSRLRIKKSEEYVSVLEFRVKSIDVQLNTYFGWGNWNETANPENLVLPGETDFIRFTVDAFGGWSVEVDNAGSGASFGTISGSNAAIWQTLKLVTTCSATAGNRKVEVYLNGTLQHTFTDETKFPTGFLRVFAGIRGQTSAPTVRECHFDWIEAGFTTKPLAA